jgi:hypothetical protein
MAQVRIDPKSKNWPYLEAGKYGPGTPNKGECEILTYECPAEEPPIYDPDNKRGPYAFIHVQVRPDNGSLVNIRHHEGIGENTGSRMIGWLINIGVPVADDGTHDDALVAGKRCIVEAGEPRADKDNPDRKFTRLRDILGAS